MGPLFKARSTMLERKDKMIIGSRWLLTLAILTHDSYLLLFDVPKGCSAYKKQLNARTSEVCAMPVAVVVVVVVLVVVLMVVLVAVVVELWIMVAIAVIQTIVVKGIVIVVVVVISEFSKSHTPLPPPLPPEKRTESFNSVGIHLDLLPPPPLHSTPRTYWLRKHQLYCIRKGCLICGVR